VDIIEPVPEKAVLEKPKPVWTAPSWKELIDIAKTAPEVQELFDQGAKLVAVEIAGTADTGEAALTLELDEEKWMVRIDLANGKVTKVELVSQVEPGERVYLFNITEKA